MLVHSNLKTENYLLVKHYEDILQTDLTYQRWLTLRLLWDRLGFSNFAKTYHDLDSDTGNTRALHGTSLEYQCTDTILETV